MTKRPEIVWQEAGLGKFSHFVLYDDNPPRWWQFWRKRWLRTMRYGPIIAAGSLDETTSV